MGATIQVRGSVGARDSLGLEMYNPKADLRRSRGGGGRCGRSNEVAASERLQACRLSAAIAEPLWNDWPAPVLPLSCRERERAALMKSDFGRAARGHASCWVQAEAGAENDMQCRDGG